MTDFRQEPPGRRGPVHAERRPIFGIVLILVLVALELTGAFALALPVHPGTVAGAPPSPSAGAVPSALAPTAAPVTHGDLLVSSGQTDYIPEQSPPATPTTYYQGGNITVESGGKLIVENTTLEFVEFVATSGALETRLHLYHLTVQTGGTVLFRNATLTTDTLLLNPYAKIDVVDDGTLSFWNSSILSAGFLNVGAGGSLTLNQSTVGPNPGFGNLSLPEPIHSDFAFAPTLNVSAGGVANLFASRYTGLYADNESNNETPIPYPVSGTISLSSDASTSAFTTSASTTAILQDFLYPVGIAGATLNVSWTDTAATGVDTSGTVYLAYNGGAATEVGTVTADGNSSGYAVFPLPTSIEQTIATEGMLAFLNSTGDFGVASGITVSFGTVTGPAVAETQLTIQLQPPLDYGMQVTGADSTLNTVDTLLGLNFSASGAPA